MPEPLDIEKAFWRQFYDGLMQIVKAIAKYKLGL